MFGYFSGGRFMSALRGVDEGFYQAANRNPGIIKYILICMVICLIIKPERDEIIMRNTFALMSKLLALDFAVGGLVEGMYCFFTHRENAGRERVNQIPEGNIPNPGL
ncbi:MAG: hypothetical protein AMJ43_05825 [Coxiella sp. DG_40]|nr:MAG: hypothetical protein AMJ43_05825 [Coxiella sp. DG_40]